MHLQLSIYLYLSIFLPIYLSFFLPIYLSIHPSIYLIYLSIYLSLCISLSLYLSISVSLYLSISLSLYLSIHPSIYLSNLSIHLYLSICKLENEAIVRDVLIFWTWQHQKRSKSARLPQLLSLTTSNSKLFCETSSIFQVDNIKNEAILRDVLQKWKVECRADGLVPMRFAIFPLHLSKVHTRCCTCHAKSS